MVVQKTIDNLKDRPKDERTAVAGGIAITFAVVLFLGWGIYFFHQIQSGAVNPSFQGAGNQFDSSGIQQAQQALQQEYASTTSGFDDLRNEAAQEQVGTQGQMQTQTTSGGTDQFGNSNTSY
jgi:uncharacterized protein HemX